MQTLFAYEQCKEANNLLALDMIDERFSPDLNSMEVQDKPLLKDKKKQARQLYEKVFTGQTVRDNADKAIADTVSEAVELYHKHSKKDFSFLKKTMVAEVGRINFWYHSVLSLLTAFADAARADRKNEHAAFANNGLLEAIENNNELQKLILKEGANLSKDKATVAGWFRDVIKPDKTYCEYLTHTLHTADEEKSVVKHIVRKLILGEGIINDYFAEHNIRWAEDHDIVRSLVDKTIKSYNQEEKTITLQRLSLDWEDDVYFMETLFERAASLDDDKKELIAKNTRNWEVDRLPLTDRVILEMAIAELINFPGIPVKVTINEYIELTKQYSTPKSPKFVNGILDVMAKELQSAGAVKKSGRGLIDNK